MDRINDELVKDSVAKKLKVSKPTARSYLKKLEELGILTVWKRHYREVWVAGEIIEFIDAPQRIPQPEDNVK